MGPVLYCDLNLAFICLFCKLKKKLEEFLNGTLLLGVLIIIIIEAITAYDAIAEQIF